VLLSLALATLVAHINPRIIPAQNGNICPGGTSYAGAGYCKVRQNNVQYVPAKGGNTCPGGSSYAGAGYCKVR
jgi:hypothetical protein